MSYGYDHSKDGGPAFPISLPGWGDNGAGGMTLRDWFAGQALSSAMGQYGPVKAAEMAFAYADAMLAAREVAK